MPLVTDLSTETIILKNRALNELDKPISLTYSGKLGCACGCRGNYSDNSAAIKRTVNKMRQQIEQATAEDLRGLIVMTDQFVAIDNGGKREATRTYTAYTDGRTKN
jgi:hypothetical protein